MKSLIVAFAFAFAAPVATAQTLALEATDGAVVEVDLNQVFSALAAHFSSDHLSYESLQIIGQRAFILDPQIRINDTLYGFFGLRFGWEGVCRLFGFAGAVAYQTRWESDTVQAARIGNDGQFQTLAGTDTVYSSVACKIEP